MNQAGGQGLCFGLNSASLGSALALLGIFLVYSGQDRRRKERAKGYKFNELVPENAMRAISRNVRASEARGVSEMNATISRAMLERHLTRAEAHVVEGTQLVDRQKSLVDELECHGHDTKAARHLLAQFEDLLAMHVADVARIESELAERSD